MSKKYDVMVAQGSYQSGNETKTRWLRIGSVFATKSGGFALKLDAIPTTGSDRDGNVQPWDGWCQLFAPKEREAPRQEPRREAPPVDDTDIPF